MMMENASLDQKTLEHLKGHRERKPRARPFLPTVRVLLSGRISTRVFLWLPASLFHFPASSHYLSARRLGFIMSFVMSRF